VNEGGRKRAKLTDFGGAKPIDDHENTVGRDDQGRDKMYEDLGL
jgi:hypothetical protein